MSDEHPPSRGVPDERRAAWGEKYVPRYSGVATFLRRPLREHDKDWGGVDVGLIGVPFDGAVTPFVWHSKGSTTLEN